MRSPLFRRKGAPSVAITISHQPGSPLGAAPGGADDSAPPDPSDPSAMDGGSFADDGSAAAGDCQCPQCGCVFNPDTGEIAPGQDYQQGDQGPSAPPDGAGDATAALPTDEGSE